MSWADARAALVYVVAVQGALPAVGPAAACRGWSFAELDQRRAPVSLRVLVTQLGLIFGLVGAGLTGSPWGLVGTFVALRALGDAGIVWLQGLIKQRDLPPGLARVLSRTSKQSTESLEAEFDALKAARHGGRGPARAADRRGARAEVAGRRARPRQRLILHPRARPVRRGPTQNRGGWRYIRSRRPRATPPSAGERLGHHPSPRRRRQPAASPRTPERARAARAVADARRRLRAHAAGSGRRDAEPRQGQGSDVLYDLGSGRRPHPDHRREALRRAGAGHRHRPAAHRGGERERAGSGASATR